MLEWIVKHELWAAAGAYWIFSAAVSSMPAPAASGSAIYLWLYRFLHTIAGNVTTVFGRRIAGLTARLMVLAFVLLLPLQGCAAHYTVHPGSVSVDDSAAYDALLIAQGTIDQARTALQAGQLPDSARDPLNALIRSYNVARTSWLTYRGAITANQPANEYLQQLTQNLTDLTNAIRAFQSAGSKETR
jgi:hypothetical protein